MQAFGFSALPPDLDPEIRALIEQRVEELGEDCGLATFVVVGPGDTAGSLEAALGFGITSNHLNGTRFGEPDFAPLVEFVEEHPAFYELVFVLQDDGAGHVVLVPKRAGIDPELLAFCAAFASQPS